MAQKPMLRGEVGARALRVRSDVRGHGHKSLELQPKLWQSDPSGDADPPGRSLDSSSEGRTAEANANPLYPWKSMVFPGGGAGSLPAARTEPGEIEETPGRRLWGARPFEV
jgi:hypothetical protein